MNAIILYVATSNLGDEHVDVNIILEFRMSVMKFEYTVVATWSLNVLRPSLVKILSPLCIIQAKNEAFMIYP